jgi:hypothetical protein
MISNEGIDINQVADDGDTVFHGTGKEIALLGRAREEEELSISPNPSNPSAVIRIHWPKNMAPAFALVQLDIFGIHGNRIASLKPDREGKVVWNTARQASGLYFVKCRINGKLLTKRLVLAR